MLCHPGTEVACSLDRVLAFAVIIKYPDKVMGLLLNNIGNTFFNNCQIILINGLLFNPVNLYIIVSCYFSVHPSSCYF